MSEEDESGEKSFEPTPKKLEDARRRGDVPKSTDLNTMASYVGLLGVLLLASELGFPTLIEFGFSLMENADRYSDLIFQYPTAWIMTLILSVLVEGLAFILLVPGLLVFIALAAQRGIVFAPEKLQPKLSRISPLQGIKNKFGSSGIFEFLKSSVKLGLVGGILGWLAFRNLPELIASSAASPEQLTQKMVELVTEFLIIVTIMMLILGGIDFLWQYFQHIKKNRMTRKELQDETKQSEGDPMLKQQRRQKGQEIAMTQMLSDVPGADVIVVNPTHYAVALKWDRDSGLAPICLAKGVDEIAHRIREVAEEHEVPIYSDPPTARAIFGTVEIGGQILPEHYRAIAAAIRFAEDIRLRARK